MPDWAVHIINRVAGESHLVRGVEHQPVVPAVQDGVAEGCRQAQGLEHVCRRSACPSGQGKLVNSYARLGQGGAVHFVDTGEIDLSGRGGEPDI